MGTLGSEGSIWGAGGTGLVPPEHGGVSAGLFLFRTPLTSQSRVLSPNSLSTLLSPLLHSHSHSHLSRDIHHNSHHNSHTFILTYSYIQIHTNIPVTRSHIYTHISTQFTLPHFHTHTFIYPHPHTHSHTYIFMQLIRTLTLRYSHYP